MEQYGFLSGGGEMGALMRGKDWSKTSVGNPDQWPQSLRTTLSIILNSRFPMFLFWGPEHTCFYNDAYRPSLGNDGKHPGILGSRGEDYWQEIWPFIKPLIDEVLAGGQASWNEDQLLPIYRNGKMEDVYWTFSYSPVNDESNKPAGVFVTCVETTEKIIAFNDLKDSKDELQFTISSAELGTFDLNPVTNKFSCNEKLKEWFGLTVTDEPDLALAIDAIAPKDREKVTAAIQRALDFSSGGNYESEYTIIHPVTKKEIIVLASGRAWFTGDKKPYRLNGIVQEVTEKVTAQRKIEESERNLRLMIMNAPVSIAIFRGADYVLDIANPRALELWGRTEEQVFGKPILESMPELNEQGIKALLDDVGVNGNSFSATEYPVEILRNGNTETVYINFIYEPVYDADGKINGVMTVGYEVTNEVKTRKIIEESEERFRTMAEGTNMLIAVGDESGNAIYFNKAWTDLTGRSMKDLLDFGWANLIHPADKQGWVSIFISTHLKSENHLPENSEY